MNTTQALELLKQNKSVKSKQMIGDFNLVGERVFFACPGEYPCCHYDMTIEEFLEDYKDDEFKEI